MSSCNSRNYSIGFIAGERKSLTFAAKNPKVSNFVISNATYEITDGRDNLILNGVCEVYGKEITALVQLDDQGFYSLVITYIIGQEILKSVFVIQVAKE